MTSIYKISLFILLSQIFYLGAFSSENEPIYVIDRESNLCGEFSRGNSEFPNWLPNGWQALNKNSGLNELFIESPQCPDGGYESCCRSMGYRYAGIPIGVNSISLERKAAEFLSSINIIEAKSLEPDLYNLDLNITRKEIMKVVINTAGITPVDECQSSFDDVQQDWACKYIETALENDYIARNQKFRPNSEITKTEALKLIFKARNIDKSYTTNSWQEDYISTALYLGFLDEKYSSYNEIASRGWIFTVLAKTYGDFNNY